MPDFPSDPSPPPGRPSAEVIREFADRGMLWLFEDPANVGDLLRILDPGAAGLLDFSRAVRVNRSLVPADLQKKESDVIFSVPVATERVEGPRGVWVYLHLEHQSKRDDEMPLRFLLSMGELWEAQRRAWLDRGTPVQDRVLCGVIPIVLYTGEGRWEGPLRLLDLVEIPSALERFVPDWEILFLNLKRTSPEDLVRFTTAVGWALRVLQEERSSFDRFERAVLDALGHLEELEPERVGQWIRTVWYVLLLAFHRRAGDEYNELETRIREGAAHSKFFDPREAEAMAVTMAQECEARGEARGERRATLKALERVLSSRLGRTPAEYARALSVADTETLERWFEEALAGTPIEELGIPREHPVKDQ